jgi:Fe-S-cluster containining protein
MKNKENVMTFYECDCCGACCRGTLIVEAFTLDVIREPRVLHADVNGRVPTIDDLLEEEKCVVLAANVPCRFLGENNRCTIYPTRPNVCVGMQTGDEQCQDARERRGLPPLQPRQLIES